MSQVWELELGVGLLYQMVGSRSVGGGGELRSPRARFGSAAQMAADAVDEFAGKGDPFVEIFGVERFDEGIWVEGLGAGEKSEDPTVFGLEAELQDHLVCDQVFRFELVPVHDSAVDERLYPVVDAQRGDCGPGGVSGHPA